ncbi:MAG: hypothetical protein ABI995_09335 [Acidobacteriota bacterium]
MNSGFINVIAGAGFALEAVTIVLLLRGPVSRYLPVLLYLITLISVDVAQGLIYMSNGIRSSAYFSIFWGGQHLTDFLHLLVVLGLTSRALIDSPQRPKALKFLSAILLAVLVLPFLLFDSRPFGSQWNHSVSQLMNFGAGIMNLGLWTAILMSKKRDPQLLKVSAGLGLGVAGAAMTIGLRQFGSQGNLFQTLTDSLHMILQIASVGIWAWAFWPARRTAQPPIITASAS